MKKIITVMLLVILAQASSQSQKNDKLPRLLGDPILNDTTSTILFPVRYHEEFLSTNKIALWGEYYANIVVYDLLNDRYKRLFEKDTYIESFHRPNSYEPQLTGRPKNLTDKWIFLLVKNSDYNDSGRIDERDPSVLFVATTTGDALRSLTKENENVVSLELFNKQGFGLIKIQRDENGDKSFKADDKDIYYRKINLNDLGLGTEIEIK